MQKEPRRKERLEGLGRRLGLAGNGLFLVGSVLYLSESSVRIATWTFVVGSALALLATLLPQLIHMWFCPAEEDPESPRPRPTPRVTSAGGPRRPLVPLA